MSAATPESPKMIDLRRQMREASTLGAVSQVLANSMVAIRDKEISVAEANVLNKMSGKFINEQKARLKEQLAELKSMKR